MLDGPAGGTPSSSSRPSTRSSSLCPSAEAWSATFSSSRSRHPSRTAGPPGGRSSSPAATVSCSTTASVKALLSAWPLVTKNDTTVTPTGGCKANQDVNAVFPAQGPACHHA